MDILKKLAGTIGETIGRAIHIEVLARQLQSAYDLDAKGEYSKAERIIRDVIGMCPTWMPINEWETIIWGERATKLMEKQMYNESYKNFERAYESAYTPEIAEDIKRRLKTLERHL